MIKKAAILLLLTLSVTNTWAQFSFGLQAGVNTGGPLGKIIALFLKGRQL
jgi:hypothetical protein